MHNWSIQIYIKISNNELNFYYIYVKSGHTNVKCLSLNSANTRSYVSNPWQQDIVSNVEQRERSKAQPL